MIDSPAHWRMLAARARFAMEKKRVTQDDVAKAAGVTRPAVSLAFKKHPSIPLKTRERILRLAEQLGYRPDPMLSALAAYRMQLRTASFHGTLAWLVNVRDGASWERVPTYRDYFNGAVEQSARLGYKLETFELGARGMSAERMAGVLRARSISGILVCPQVPDASELDFAWEHFSAVTFGYTLRRPVLHTVTPTQYRACTMAMRQLFARGYRRIGFAVNQRHDERTEHNYLAAYFVEQHLAGIPAIPPLSGNRYELDTLQRWLREHQPDAIITGNYRIMESLATLKIRVPEQLGVVCPLITSPDSEISGAYEDSVAIGRVGVDLLVSLIHQGERGIPALPRRVHVECRWIEGRTLRALPDSKRALPDHDRVKA